MHKPMDGAGGDLDRISALPDDLLHIILGSVGSAPSIAKTAVLSRRWRHVWPLATSLTFYDQDRYLKQKGNLPAGCVDWVLQQRRNADMQSLTVHFTKKGHPSPEKVNEWFRFAVQRVVGSVEIRLGGPPLRDVLDDEPDDEPAVVLPSHGGRVTSITLDLSDRSRLRLPPATARYQVLEELQLWSVLFGEEDGSTLSDFLMSCCPRLRRLEIGSSTGLTHLLLHTEVLEELVICYAHDLKTLDVMAPNLRVIELDLSIRNRLKMRIMAPRLEEIHGNFPCKPPDLDICTTPLKNVRVLKSLHLDMHGKYHLNGDVCFWLLDNCPGVQHLNVCVSHFPTPTMFHGLLTMDKLLEGEAPFANLRTMVISSHLPKHHLVPSISLLLMRCPHLTSLTIRIYSPVRNRSEKCLCEALTDKFAIHGKLELESLREVKISGFSGTDEEMQLVSSLFASKNSIKRMDIGLRFPEKIKKRIRAQAANNIFHELTMKIPCADQARLSFADKNKGTGFAWTCYWTWL